MRLRHKQAYAVAPGYALLLQRDGETTVCLKAERAGKEYVHHYAVPLAPAPDGPLGMIYLDPEDAVIDCGQPVCFDLAETLGAPAEPGDIFENPRGAFLKVVEDPKSQKMFGYVELASGQLIRRQERKVAAVYRGWRISGLGRDGGISLDDLPAALDNLGPE